MRLTADHCALAIIAAARVYGDDPVVAFTVKSGKTRRAIAPAAFGLAVATGAQDERCSRTIGGSPSSMFAARRIGGQQFESAIVAAARAVISGAPPVQRPSQGPVRSAPAPTPAKRAKLASTPIAAGPFEPHTAAALPVFVQPGMSPDRLAQIKRAVQSAPNRSAEPPLPKFQLCTWVGEEACSLPVVAGKSYCAEHSAIVYKSGSAIARKLEKSAVRLAGRAKQGFSKEESVLALDGRPA